MDRTDRRFVAVCIVIIIVALVLLGMGEPIEGVG